MQQRYLFSPKVAVGSVIVVAVAVAAAAFAREDDVTAVVERAVDPPVAPATAPVLALASAPPRIEGVKARAQLAQLGVDLELDVAVTLPAPLQSQEFVMAKASCKLDGEWYSGTSSLRLRDVPAGTSVLPARVRLGGQHAFAQTPTECQLGFEYTSFVVRPVERAWLARMCWDGTRVSEQPCPTRPNDGVSVSAVRVETSAQRYRMRTLGGPVDLEVSLDAEIKRPLDSWTLEVAAACTLPDGTTHRANGRVRTYDVHAGRPFTSSALLFRRGQQMLDVPTSCTLAIELADRAQLVREPVSAWCWRDGTVASGACV
jgi:hypothetical protein